jgi:hypothetical protein
MRTDEPEAMALFVAFQTLSPYRI